MTRLQRYHWGHGTRTSELTISAKDDGFRDYENGSWEEAKASASPSAAGHNGWPATRTSSRG